MLRKQLRIVLDHAVDQGRAHQAGDKTGGQLRMGIAHFPLSNPTTNDRLNQVAQFPHLHSPLDKGRLGNRTGSQEHEHLRGSGSQNRQSSAPRRRAYRAGCSPHPLPLIASNNRRVFQNSHKGRPDRGRPCSRNKYTGCPFQRPPRRQRPGGGPCERGGRQKARPPQSRILSRFSSCNRCIAGLLQNRPVSIKHNRRLATDSNPTSWRLTTRPSPARNKQVSCSSSFSASPARLSLRAPA